MKYIITTYKWVKYFYKKNDRKSEKVLVRVIILFSLKLSTYS